MKPIFSIDDFSQGISYDETENIVNGFNDLVNIDLKNINGVAMLANLFVAKTATTNFTSVGTEIFLDNASNFTKTSSGFSDVFYVKGGGGVCLYKYNTYANTFAAFGTDTGFRTPTYGETIFFQNRLFYCGFAGRISSVRMWNTGQAYGIHGDGTNVVAVYDTFGNTVAPVVAGLVGATLTIDTGVTYTITAVNTGSQTLTLSGTLATGTYLGYAYIQDVNGVTKDDNTTTALSLPRSSNFYRPMADFNSKLYVGDGDMICTLDDTLTNWKTTNGNGAISVGTDYTVKRIEQIGGYLYILADSIKSDVYNTFSGAQGFYNSKLYIWDGVSVGFQNIIDVGTYGFDIKVAENRIYALLRSKKNDGCLFTYFNGSDFPTIAKLQIDNVKARVHSIAYDRGRFYFTVYGTSRVDGTTGGWVFGYSAYALETPNVTKLNYFPSVSTDNFIIEFINRGYSGTSTPKEELMIHGQSGASTIIARDETKYKASGDIISQKYEITPNQFGQLVKGIQLNFKETMTSDCSVLVKYRGDEETTYSTIGTITSANQNNVLYGIMKRFKKIQLKLTPQTNTGTNTPKIVKISLY